MLRKKIPESTIEIIELEQEASTHAHLIINEHTAHECEMIANGAFSPLSGFMCKSAAESVIRTMRLPDNEFWPIPILLPINESLLSNFHIGEKIALYDANQRLIAFFCLEEKFTLDLTEYCEQVLQTSSENHPGVRKIIKAGNTFIGGKILQLVNRPERVIKNQYYLDPQDTRKIFQQKSWKTIVAFHTRNPIHRAHEYLTKVALENYDGLLLHPVIGETRPDDIPASVRMCCYEILYEKYYNKNHVYLATLPSTMHYAGPREALYHMIIRKNYGCTHIIIGRDHAGVGSYYGVYEAQKLANKYSSEIGIIPLNFEQAFYCSRCESVTSHKVCPHDEADHLSLSGTRVRDMLREGVTPPKEFSRPEVSKILIEWAKDNVASD